MPDGILCIDKPAGMTSFDVVAVLRGLLHERRAGHGGTLDPMATGVLPLFFGRATKAAWMTTRDDKRYTAEFRLGITTDSGDITGAVLRQCPVTADLPGVRAAVEKFHGELWQTPPMVSAVKVGGTRLYKLARQGVEIEREPRRITIYEIKLAAVDESAGVYTLDVHCSGGTYIRSLVGDIGEALGCGATVTSLRRTLSHGYALADCLSLDEARTLSYDELLGRLQSVETIFEDLASVAITGRQAVRFRNGGWLSVERVDNCPAAGRCRVKEQSGDFLGVGEVSDGEIKPIRIF